MEEKPRTSPQDPALHIRPFREEDGGAIVALSESTDMDTLTEFENTTVVTQDGTIVGFIRISIHGGIAYVNPVVVDITRQGGGIGTLLMQKTLQRYKELRFIARGYAVPFYVRLGCKPIPWSMIADEIASDCDQCDRRATCTPLPMRISS